MAEKNLGMPCDYITNTNYKFLWYFIESKCISFTLKNLMLSSSFSVSKINTQNAMCFEQQ